MLWGVQIQVRRKLALGGIFSLVIITISFAIIRTVAVTTLTRLPDTSWLYMWSAIETTVGKKYDQSLQTIGKHDCGLTVILRQH